MEDDEESKSKWLGGPVLDAISIDDLHANIAELDAGFNRVHATIVQKRNARGRAYSFFSISGADNQPR